MAKCSKCDGRGNLPWLAHIQGGICFQCQGTGQVEAKEGEASDEVCDSMHHLVKYGQDELVWVQFGIQGDKAGVSSWCSSLEGEEYFTPREGISLAEARTLYSQYLADGFKKAGDEDRINLEDLRQRADDRVLKAYDIGGTP